jgi:hypothetical protein
MLVCNVSQSRRRASIAASVSEAAAALDTPGTGNIVFATLVDDPASVREHVDAFFGQIMLEAASATDRVSWGLTYAAAIGEAASALDTASATSTSPVVPTTLNPADKDTHITLSNGNLTAAGTAGWTGLVRAVKSQSAGKFYWETTFNATQVNSGVGLAVGSLSVSTQTFSNAGTGKSGLIQTGNVYVDGAATFSIGGVGGSGISFGTISSGAVICVAVDVTAKLIWWRLGAGGNWNNVAGRDPATGVGGANIPNVGTTFPTDCFGGADTLISNFGATAFTGTVPSGFTAGWPS